MSHVLAHPGCCMLSDSVELLTRATVTKWRWRGCVEEHHKYLLESPPFIPQTTFCPIKSTLSTFKVVVYFKSLKEISKTRGLLE